MQLPRLAHHSLAIATAGLGLSLAACAVEIDEDLADLDEDSLATTEQSVLSGWTPFTSEEYPPITCDGPSLPSEIYVTGPYADNLQLRCQQDSRIVRADSYWTNYFSEEYNGMTYCPRGYWITGMACQGRYCDNVSIQCTRILNSYPTLVSGFFGGPVSEEQGRLYFGGKYPVGAMCLGPYCDELRFATAYLNVTTPDYSDRLQ
jgi:hypothetical protein